MEQIICKDVTLGYEGKSVVSKINFTVNRGDYLCIVGENGSGKSTLIKALLKLIEPLDGKIIRNYARTYGIGYLPQQTQVQKDFPASVLEIVMSGCNMDGRFHPFYSAEDKKCASRAMEMTGVDRIKNHCYRDLSGGQQQRVLLARALCSTGEILLLDEPVAGLDPLVMREMYDLIDDLNQKEKITIIMVSHDIVAAIKHASHILHIAETPLFFGTKEEYLQTEIGRAFMSVASGKEADHD